MVPRDADPGLWWGWGTKLSLGTEMPVKFDPGFRRRCYTIRPTPAPGIRQEGLILKFVDGMLSAAKLMYKLYTNGLLRDPS